MIIFVVRFDVEGVSAVGSDVSGEAVTGLAKNKIFRGRRMS